MSRLPRFLLPACLAGMALAMAACPKDDDVCTPRCDGTSCGDDGCGNRCTCANGATCNESTFACCTPQCEGRSCGADGCGGSCGECHNGGVCNPYTFQCQGGCTPSCEGRVCGSDGCGGSCGTCGEGQSCNETNGQCGAACVPSCGSAVCGDDGCGGSCGNCGDGATCEAGACVAGPACDDLQRNGSETDVDCGGTCAQRCAVGRGCSGGSDCTSGSCESQQCVAAPTCANDAQDAGETDLNCGGPNCAPCAKGKYCQYSSDCLTEACVYGVCEAPSCGDDIRNQGETGIDCGGPCEGCDDGQRCLEPDDCNSGDCSANRCISCYDRVLNGTETATDCGGGRCPGCANGQACREGTDCQGGGCEDRLCCTANACGFCGELSQEVCDGKDNDCSGYPDDNLPQGDLCPKQAGPCAGARAECRGAAGWVCDDAVYEAHDYRYRPDEKGYCDDSLDNDCDGKANWDDTADCCKPACDGRDCGGDGCGGTCGTCGAKETCSTDGKCEANCGAYPDSTCDYYCGLQYGSGGCYCIQYMCDQDPASCCPDFKACCGTCTPDCNGKACGDDGCGGQCGTCPDGETCNASGQCKAPECGLPENWERTCNGYCGADWNMYYTCSCAAGCATAGNCCPDYKSCCGATDPCHGIGYEGCCKGTVVYYCDGGQLGSQECAGSNLPACGWYGGDTEGNDPGYYCTTTSGSDPSGIHPRTCPF